MLSAALVVEPEGKPQSL